MLLPVVPPVVPPVVAPDELLPLPMLLPEPMLPEVPEPMLPVPLVELPYFLTQSSRSVPLRPLHWLGRDAELPAAVLLPPTLEPVVPPAEAPVLDDPLAPALPAPDCAHDALATPTSAAATAAAIVLTITFESPWSVEEVLHARRCKSSACPGVVSTHTVSCRSHS